MRALWIAGLLAACKAAPAPQPVLSNRVRPRLEPVECVIAGGIYDSASGEPLAGATIIASNDIAERAAITDEKGLFSLRSTGAPGTIDVYYADAHVTKQVTCERNLVVRFKTEPEGPIIVW